MRAAAIMFGETLYRAWGGLLQSVQTGEPAFGPVLGMPIYQFTRYFARERERIFKRTWLGTGRRVEELPHG